MIIKGGSRGAPTQLAWHLQRRDTNETVEILELQWPGSDLKEAFRDWQILVEGTRGTKGLYHANIDPAQEYTLTPEQWRRSVEVLEKELGLDGQPRAIVKHEKHGREHVHVVWARTDIDRMVLRSDSQNYLAHERASKALEMEFGHKPVPGKHAKRDRDKQPEFPRAIADQAEWQQGERTNLDPAARKEQVTSLKQACDNGQAFKTALEEKGYILAKGDRRDFVIVDEAGSIHSLGRQIRDMKAAELRAFMKDVDREALPSTDEAKEVQHRRQQEIRKAKPQENAPEPDAPSVSATSPPAEVVPDPHQSDIEALKKAVAERQAEERRRLVETHAAELEKLRAAIDRDTRDNLEHFAVIQRREAEARKQREAEEAPAGIFAFFSAVQDFLAPGRAEERDAERRRQDEEFAARQKQEREDYKRKLQGMNDLELSNVSERHAMRLQDHATRREEELERHLREREAAIRLRAEFEEEERRREEERKRDAPERPPPKRVR